MFSFIISGILALSLNASGGQSDKNPPSLPAHEKAVRHFKESFKNASGERWTAGAECYRVSFVDESVKHVVDYHLNGKWRNTIRMYNEPELPEDIRRQIKTGFVDSEIILVTELQFEQTLAYFVKIRQNGWSKTIQVIDGNTDVIEEFEER